MNNSEVLLSPLLGKRISLNEVRSYLNLFQDVKAQVFCSQKTNHPSSVFDFWSEGGDQKDDVSWAMLFDYMYTKTGFRYDQIALKLVDLGWKVPFALIAKFTYF